MNIEDLKVEEVFEALSLVCNELSKHECVEGCDCGFLAGVQGDGSGWGECGFCPYPMQSKEEWEQWAIRRVMDRQHGL